MKAGLGLQDFLIKADRENKMKRDFIVSSTAMYMEDGAELFSISRQLDSGMREVEPFQVSDLAHRQVGSVLGIPAKYYDKCRFEYPDLLTQNVNGWLGRNDSRHMLRTLDGTLRAFLSSKYRRYDNYDILHNILPVVAEMPDARVETCEITDHRMYLKVVNPRLQLDVVPGDTVQAGIVISNSEVGLGSVSVMPLVYRLVCANGMVVNDLGKRKYHIGRENEESWELFSDETLALDDAAFMAKLADIVRTAVDEAKFALIIDKLREATEAKITARVPDVVELTAKNYGFNQTEQDDILQHLILGGDLSLYGLSNAVTRTANDAESYERATALETAGWHIATMEPRLWRELNDVAA